MNGTFNGQILVDKLAKLNNSQQSIETLSHWCIFHRKKAKQVVETWERQFHCSPREQRISFLYLANDILQNSRRKGSEFVGEFWKVLPDALSDVIENGDDFGRNAVFRLIDIWEDRKVFGSRGQVLKEELLGRNVEYKSRNGKNSSNVLPSTGAALEKIVSSYEAVYDGPVEEDAVMAKCRTAISFVVKVEKEVGDYNSGNPPVFVEELQGQHQVLRECIEQLRVAESSRATLISHLKGTLQDQEYKLEQLRDQLQVAQSRFDQAGNICQQILNTNNGQPLSDHRLHEAAPTYPDLPPNFAPEATTAGVVEEKKELSAPPVMYTQKLSATENPLSEEDHRKTTAAAVAAKLAASTSSAQMLSYVLSSLASEGVIGKPLNESSSMDFPPEKKPKHDNGPSASYVPTQINPPHPSYPHPDSLQHSIPIISSPHQLPLSTSLPNSLAPPTMQQPQQPPLPPLQPPPPPGQFVQTAGPMTNVPFSYGSVTHHLPPGYAMAGMPLSSVQPYPTPPNQFPNVQASDSGFFNQQPLSATPPMSRP
ncbi:uncharacterized protein [Aristolochia californica]|uniref:uncharacterized protein isoform X2 n=1 Tax=Aristolochia californica TaxID=171875 RepID=UPI0035D9E304